ncbi:Mlp-like protein [Thalictrum thalictroides]|uniref:Mlp-like protein n=1 Tax=Thalictrum thalictroides TaxID=46969 RepID=A0A7J6V808_THATH|nr:Mlp-like protein [Thalictrum thalictroides]
MDKVECEIEVKSPVETFWGGLKDSTTIFPKIFPQRIKNIEIIEGDGTSVGTVRLLTYVEGTPFVTFAKEKVELIDDEKKTLGYSVIEGELTTLFKTLKVNLQIVPKGEDEGSLVKWCMEFEKENQDVTIDPHHLKENATKAYTGLDAYLNTITA